MRCALLGAAALCLGLPFARAQGLGPAGRRLGKLLEHEARRELLLEHGGELEIDAARGRVAVAGPGVHLRVGRALELFAEGGLVLWGRIEDGALEGLRAVYAEGDVVLRLYDDSFVGERAYVDLERGRASFRRVTLRASEQGRGRALWARGRAAGRARAASLLVRAGAIEASGGLSRFEARDAEVSTCTFERPHWALRAARLTLARREEPDGAQRVAGTVRAPTLEVLGTPLLSLPWTVPWDADWLRWAPRIELGQARRFGPYVRTAWPIVPRRELVVEALADGLWDRGPAGGLQGRWRDRSGHRRFEGDLLAWYVRDFGTDRFAQPPPRHDRARIALFHRSEIGAGLRPEIELNWLSDERVLSEFYEREAKQGREQTSAGYVLWRRDNRAATALVRGRLNDFQQQVEHLPRLRFDWIGQPLLPLRRPPYLEVSYRVSRSRQRYPDDVLVPGRLETWVDRADLDQVLRWPIGFGGLRLLPFAQARVSGFSELLDPAAGQRVGTRLRGGAVLTADLWRDFEVGDRWRWRHVLTPSVGYEELWYDDLGPEDLIPIDEIEQRTRYRRAIVWSVRNRLVAIGSEPGEKRWRRRDLFDLRLAGSWLPEPDPADGRRWGRLRARLRLDPFPGFAVRARAVWDPERGARERASATVALRPHPDVSLAASYFAFEKTNEAVGGSIALRLGPRWGLTLSSQYDLVSGSFVSNRVALRRTLHRFVLELAVDADFGENDVRFSVNFNPLELFEDPLGQDPWKRRTVF
ncbi:MAG: hypothetical protein D6776_01440 [Planctomycetota bacterium]|nr:MAG: hypothetical protein D6776_01440 [Planctomycetota bacterium]